MDQRICLDIRNCYLSFCECASRTDVTTERTQQPVVVDEREGVEREKHFLLRRELNICALNRETRAERHLVIQLKMAKRFETINPMTEKATNEDDKNKRTH